MKLTPTQYYLLVELHDVKTDAKIIVPEGVKVMPYGKVVAAGPDCKFCAVGDIVLFNLSNMIGFETLGQFIIAEGSVFAKGELEGEDEGLRILTPQ